MMYVSLDLCPRLDMHMPQLMHIALGYCCFMLYDVSLAMHACQSQCFLDYPHKPRICRRHGSCVKSLDDVAWRWTKSFARWAHVMFMHVGLGWCNMSLAHVTCEIQTFHLWFSKPWIKPHSIGRRPFQDVHMPCHMHVGLWWYYLSCVDISRSICVVRSRNILS